MASDQLYMVNHGRVPLDKFWGAAQEWAIKYLWVRQGWVIMCRLAGVRSDCLTDEGIFVYVICFYVGIPWASDSLLYPGYNGFCGSCSTPFMEPETSKFSSQLSA